MPSDALRSIPAAHRFTQDPAIAAYDATLGHRTVRSCVQAVLHEARAAAQAGRPFLDYQVLRQGVLARLTAQESAGLVAVINGTGVLLHTNLGRAPLSSVALEAVAKISWGYSSLELDMQSGGRGDRYSRASPLLREVSGAEDALVVNNCAAAILLVIDTFARNREVVVSRGQLIEIGGSFRLPDVLRKSGASLVEVGTTNKTYGSDYRNAWTPNTAMLMRTHASNYEVLGFTHELGVRAMAALAAELGVMSFEDLGSGALIDTSAFGLRHEPTVAESIEAGIDIVAVSGDKLMGGPQCGIIFGRARFIDAMKNNPLLRALRVDKMTLAALGATLGSYQHAERIRELPLYSMLSASVDELLGRARRLCALLSAQARQARFEPVDTAARTGGGTMPLHEVASVGIRITMPGGSAEDLSTALRGQRPPVIGRVIDDALIIDLRTIPQSQEDGLLRALCATC